MLYQNAYTLSHIHMRDKSAFNNDNNTHVDFSIKTRYVYKYYVNSDNHFIALQHHCVTASYTRLARNSQAF